MLAVLLPLGPGDELTDLISISISISFLFTLFYSAIELNSGRRNS